MPHPDDASKEAWRRRWDSQEQLALWGSVWALGKPREAGQQERVWGSYSYARDPVKGQRSRPSTLKQATIRSDKARHRERVYELSLRLGCSEPVRGCVAL